MFLTEDDYKLASERGIPREVVDDRFYELGWSVSKAINRPVSEGTREKEMKPHQNRFGRDELGRFKGVHVWKEHEEHIKEAASNGVSKKTYQQRVKQGWSVEKAKTTVIRQSHKTDEYIKHREIAKTHNISPSTFLRRVKAGWDIEVAATKPSKSRRWKNAKKEVPAKA